MARKINYDNWSKEELIKELRRIKETKYGLVWHRDLPEEKIDILINPDARTPSEMFPNEMARKPFPVLKETKNKEISGDKDKPVNLLIEGDNYHSLAVLNFTHKNAVDLIYIDPPYNTGNNDFIYNDKIKSNYVPKDDPFRHSKWLAFMEKRLKLAKNLLKKDGVMFMSIDDNEFAQLKLLADEIFDEKNFLGSFIWVRKKKGSHLSETLRKMTEYILAYKKEEIKPFYGEEAYKDKWQPLLKRTNAEKILSFKDDIVEATIPDGKYLAKIYGRGGTSVSLQNDIEIKDGRIKNAFSLRGRFVWTQSKLDDELKLGTRIAINSLGFGPNVLRWDQDEKIKRPSTLINGDVGVGTNEDANEEIKKLFNRIGDNDVFSYPKPVSLIKYLTKIVTNDRKHAVILDFMAGSGTTGHAVLEMNREDGGHRQFILCTNNEDNNGSGLKIASDICYPRIKKVIKGYKNTKGESITGLGGNLKYYKTDFVEAEPTDRNKRKLVSESTEMLCIRENAFELVQDESDFKIFKNGDKYLGIVFYEEAIGDFKKAIKKIKGHFNTYVFSLGDDPHEKQFADVKGKVALCAIPEVILKVYREIFK